MPEMGFQDLRSGFRARDFSPDSVIFTGESNFSIFSSASGSVERCSFASDLPDQVSLASAVSQHLAGRGLSQVLIGPDPDPNKSTMSHKNNVNIIIRKEKTKVQKFKSGEAETTDDENITTDSSRNSFSQALKECQDRRLRSEVLLKKSNRPRPASLDLNNSIINTTNSISPRFGVMKKPTTITRRTSTFPSPGTPYYRHESKGWSSERVPLHTNRNHKSVNNGLFLYNNNGRTLPSKWEDAERWIFSPVSGNGSMKSSVQQAKGRPKSKSGPLGPPGIAYHQMFSPSTPMFDGRNNGKVIAWDGSEVRYGGCEGIGNFVVTAEPCMGRSISIHGCSQMVHQSYLLGQKAYTDEKYDETKDSANNISRVVSRRDMATQMSPDSSIKSSPRRRSSFSLATPSLLPLVQLHNMNSSRSEIRDVPVDERLSVNRWSKKNKSKNTGTGNRNVDDWKEKALTIRPTSWEISTETSKNISKIQRGEAKITAWENLQKAKAEAAIRKLEMKLEKKRSSSMDKIMNKLKSAQKKAQEMRSSSHHIGRSSSDKTLSFRRTCQFSSLSGCFTCYAF